MAETLISVGLDIGTTTTQLIVSTLEIQNSAGAFSTPEMEITKREIIYKSDIYFTPLKDGELVDAEALREIVEKEYIKAGIERSDVDTGAIIITGETSRKENARAVLEQLSDFAGDFVVASAGPELESVLAARGADADVYSERTGKTVLHMDIGGGTSNLALIKDGKIEETGCLNVGGRLLKFDNTGRVRYVSPVLRGLCDVAVGDVLTKERAEEIADMLTSALEMAAGKRKAEKLLEELTTEGTNAITPRENVIISFSGGVADCINNDVPWLKYGDLGAVLGKTIGKSRLCENEYIMGRETIRATVIGAGCYSAVLSGSTVFYRNIEFPIKNIPVVRYSKNILRDISRFDENVIIAIENGLYPRYAEISELADKIVEQLENRPIYVCAESDMAKALGQAIAMRVRSDREILCIDRIRISDGDYLDIGKPVGPALPVVIKTLVLSQ